VFTVGGGGSKAVPVRSSAPAVKSKPVLQPPQPKPLPTPAPVPEPPSPEPTTAPAVDGVKIVFDIRPTNATVVLDDEVLAPSTRERAFSDSAAVHRLEVSAAGYAPETVTFSADQEQTLSIHLKSLPGGKRAPRGQDADIELKRSPYR
ncbi:MAG: hypothetical protein PHU25_15960, partial [Deltaproteobacteria bacterium]|nr:hypothetical protein [Deltaproteobacteria bacterium]